MGSMGKSVSFQQYPDEPCTLQCMYMVDDRSFSYLYKSMWRVSDHESVHLDRLLLVPMLHQQGTLSMMQCR
jgi:hypothetical protein